MSRHSDARIKLVGVGNRYRGDDGVGLHVIELLQQFLPDEKLAASDGDITGLLDVFTNHDEVVIIDAVKAAQEPGAVVRLDGCRAALSDTGLRSSTHAMGLAEAVEMARSLGQLPQQLLIYGIVGSQFANVEGLSDAVQASAKKLAQQLAEEYAGA